jgi:glyoxylase-like metal-dependent hydrolase (beta-lactamase superfamily II)
MPLEIVSFQLGPLENNTYLVADPRTGQAAVVDPSFESETLLDPARERGWAITAIWLTHAHFDHIAGIGALTRAVGAEVPVWVHPDDLPLWREGGGARLFGMQIEAGPEPAHFLAHGQSLALGSQQVEVRHTPGHSPGHVIFYAAEAGAALCGDLIFFRGVGRTDLPGSSHYRLLRSIREQVFTLPPATRLLSGHGSETIVEEEMRENPFL